MNRTQGRLLVLPGLLLRNAVVPMCSPGVEECGIIRTSLDAISHDRVRKETVRSLRWPLRMSIPVTKVLLLPTCEELLLGRLI